MTFGGVPGGVFFGATRPGYFWFGHRGFLVLGLGWFWLIVRPILDSVFRSVF